MTKLTDEQLDDLAFHVPHVKAWVKAVENEIQRAIEGGAKFKNAELVPKSATRKWSIGAEILAHLRKFSKLDVCAPRVPLSPTQAEKTLGPKAYAALSQFVVRESSGMKLAFTHPEETEEPKD